MGNYVPEEVLMPVGLDELGLRSALERLQEEPLSNYRRRLLLEARDPSGPTGENMIRHVNRKVGQFELPLFDVGLLLDGDDLPLASDPHIEITSMYLRAYYDHENDGLDFEISFVDSQWMEAVVTSFSTSTYFALTTLDDYGPYLPTRHLRICSSTKMISGRQLLNSYQNTMPHRHLKEMWFSNPTVFQDLKSTRGEVTESGDYWIDYDEGTLISYDVQAGNAYYRYGDFPFRMYWQPVRVVYANDADLDYDVKSMLVSDETGGLAPLALNSRGSALWNKVLAVHPLGWGK